MSNAKRQRSGGIYIVVVMVSLLVAALAMTAVTAAHSLSKSMNERNTFQQLESLGMSGLEWAVATLSEDADWRRQYENDTPYEVAYGNGRFSLRLLDSDGALDDEPQDPADIIVTAHRDGNYYSLRATLLPAGPPLACLEHGVATAGDFTVDALIGCSCDASAAANGDIEINGDCYAAGSVSGNYFGDPDQGENELEFPSPSSPYYYLAYGTEIDLTDLPNAAGTYVLDYFLLSANDNTLTGEVNPRGICFIDCGGQRLDIGNCRLDCTLVVFNMNGSLHLTNSIHWAPPNANQPALLVVGDLSLRMGAGSLNESNVQFNFNPSTTPYLGRSDRTQQTIYPSELQGLVYATGDIDTGGLTANAHLWGSLIAGGDINGTSKFAVQHRDQTVAPPMGFRSFSQVRIMPGTVRRIPTP